MLPNVLPDILGLVHVTRIKVIERNTVVCTFSFLLVPSVVMVGLHGCMV